MDKTPFIYIIGIHLQYFFGYGLFLCFRNGLAFHGDSTCKFVNDEGARQNSKNLFFLYRKPEEPKVSKTKKNQDKDFYIFQEKKEN